MAILFAANTATELGGGTSYSVPNSSITEPNTINNVFNNGPGSTFNGFDPDYAPEAIGVYLASSAANLGFTINTTAPSGDYWFHCRVQMPSTTSGNADGMFWAFFDAAGDRIAEIDISNGDFFIEVFGDTSATGLTFTFSAYAAVMMDVRISTSGGNLTGDVYVNGVLVSSATVANTGGVGPVTSMQSIHDDMVNSADTNAAWVFYSEIIIADGESTLNWRLGTMQPDTQGDNNDMTGDPSVLLNNDGNTLSTDNVGDRESWNLTAYNGPASPAGIRAVVTKTRSQAGITGPQQMRHHLRIASTDYDSGLLTPDPANGEMVVWDDNPATTSPWATSDFASLQQGVEAET